MCVGYLCEYQGRPGDVYKFGYFCGFSLTMLSILLCVISIGFCARFWVCVAECSGYALTRFSP